MTLLIDTHVLLWWWAAPTRISPRVLALIRQSDTRVLVSAASAWEISTKWRIGKYPNGSAIISQWEERLAADRFGELPISAAQALKAGAIIGDHRDPFDRMIAAQSLMESIPVASIDDAISGLGAERIWA
mgnify:CR=1 FL=1